MPGHDWVIQDTQTGLYCTVYNADLTYVGWGNILNAVRWSTEGEVDAAIAAWGQTYNRYIGSNPPPPHP